MFENVWLEYVVLYFILFALIFFRYLMVSYIFYFIYFVLKFDTYKGRKVSKALRKPKQSQKEIRLSFIASGIFAFGALALLIFWKEGIIKIYEDPGQYGYWYLPVSLFAVMFIHETYYYWLHRWMHKPGIYQYVHKGHHDSKVTSAWTSFAFDPIESFLQAVFLPIVLLFIPLHVAVVALLLMIMTISATINHLDIEIYPKGFNRNPIGKWFIGATHHGLHHTEFITNYGLYFTFWDKWMNTESKKYDALFDELTNKKLGAQ